jgi:uncharacterized protein involved in exopolysaccharide biosynthesis
MRLASHFYPASWRRRYALEFDAMLDEVDADWRDFFDTLKGALTMQFTSWNLKTIALVFAMIGAVIATAVAFSIPNRYSSEAVMRFSGDADLRNTAMLALSRPSLEKMITELGLYKDQRTDKPMETIVERMRMDTSIRKIHTAADLKSPTAFAVTFTYPNAKLAQAVTLRMVEKFAGLLPHSGAVTSINVVDPPNLPQQPSYPNRALMVSMGLSGGLLIGLLVSLSLGWRIVVIRRPAH